MIGLGPDKNGVQIYLNSTFFIYVQIIVAERNFDFPEMFPRILPLVLVVVNGEGGPGSIPEELTKAGETFSSLSSSSISLLSLSFLSSESALIIIRDIIINTIMSPRRIHAGGHGDDGGTRRDIIRRRTFHCFCSDQ